MRLAPCVLQRIGVLDMSCTKMAIVIVVVGGMTATVAHAQTTQSHPATPSAYEYGNYDYYNTAAQQTAPAPLRLPRRLATKPRPRRPIAIKRHRPAPALRPKPVAMHRPVAMRRLAAIAAIAAIRAIRVVAARAVAIPAPIAMVAAMKSCRTYCTAAANCTRCSAATNAARYNATTTLPRACSPIAAA